MFEHKSSGHVVILSIFIPFFISSPCNYNLPTVTFIFNSVQGFVSNLELKHKHY